LTDEERAIEMTLYEALDLDELDKIYSMFEVERALPCRVRSISVSNEMPTQRNDKSLNTILARKSLNTPKKQKKSSSLVSLEALQLEHIKRLSASMEQHEGEKMKKLNEETAADEDYESGFVTSLGIKPPKINLFDVERIQKSQMSNSRNYRLAESSSDPATTSRNRFDTVKSKLADYMNDIKRPQVSRNVKRVRKAKTAIDNHYYTASSYLYYKDRVVDANSYLKLSSQLEAKIRDDRGTKNAFLTSIKKKRCFRVLPPMVSI
jgi:hypothetical protein